MKFHEYKGLDLVATGNEVLDRWRKNHAFEKSLELREGAPEFIFLRVRLRLTVCRESTT